MSAYRFAPPPDISLPIAGASDRYAVRRIFCVGRNYEAHAKEMGFAADRESPFYFTKAPFDYAPSGATIAYPPGTANFHYEMELVVAIGAAAFRVEEADALRSVFGYACGLDMTRRDLQFQARDKSRPWDLGKDFEQAAVLSAVVPVAQAGHPTAAAIELRVNGVTRQSSNTALLMNGVPAIIADLSRFYRLGPGDLIYTGTPDGVGPVQPGDVLEGSIAGVGTIAAKIGPPLD